jgi:hypothetical protein
MGGGVCCIVSVVGEWHALFVYTWYIPIRTARTLLTSVDGMLAASDVIVECTLSSPTISSFCTLLMCTVLVYETFQCLMVAQTNHHHVIYALCPRRHLRVEFLRSFGSGPLTWLLPTLSLSTSLHYISLAAHH